MCCYTVIYTCYDVTHYPISRGANVCEKGGGGGVGSSRKADVVILRSSLTLYKIGIIIRTIPNVLPNSIVINENKQN